MKTKVISKNRTAIKIKKLRKFNPYNYKPIELKNLIHGGNNKLPGTTAIFNFGCAVNCPSKKLGLCKVCKFCFACNDEILHVAPLFYHIRQGYLWNKLSAEQFAEDFRAINKRKRNKYTEIRFSEASDIFDQSNLDKLVRIAQLLPEINIYTYSARKDLKFNLNVPNLNFNGSNCQLNNSYTAVEILPDKLNSDQVICAGSCKVCTYCVTGKNLKILAKLRKQRYNKPETVAKYQKIAEEYLRYIEITEANKN